MLEPGRLDVAAACLARVRALTSMGLGGGLSQGAHHGVLAVRSGGVVMTVRPCSGAWCYAGSRKKTVAPSSTPAAASFSAPLLLSSLNLVCWCEPHGGGEVNAGLGLGVLLL